ncbi:MAG: YggT family protein [Actinomycetaceae bacterium]|nr:YggT family protein [Actinomycetaceae bacterium]
MSLVIYYLILVLRVYTLVILARVVLDWVRLFARTWRPRGILLFLFNLVYALTDPPLRFLNRYIPPLRLGPMALDLGFLVLFFGLSFLIRILYFV